MINPTRMELIKLKKKIKTAQRGHKLLKDKRDGLMQEFMAIIRLARDLRQKVEEKLGLAFQNFLFASSKVSPAEMQEALIWPNLSIELSAKTKNIMSVEIPKFDFKTHGKNFKCYSEYSMSKKLDKSLETFQKTLPDLIKLAEVEHSARLLAYEIEKTRRRVNALEYVFIPEMAKNIKYITAKLNEQERGALVALMKVKQKIVL
ncbi:MAG: V-type ATP synthase subunit D [bacterium]